MNIKKKVRNQVLGMIKVQFGDLLKLQDRWKICQVKIKTQDQVLNQVCNKVKLLVWVQIKKKILF
jgi:hypothetical protein